MNYFVNEVWLIFLAACYIQVAFFGIFLVVLILKRRARRPGSFPVSVVIAARNEEKNLRELLPLLLSQQHPAFEIVVIDDRSSDETYDYVLNLSRKDPRIKLVHIDQTPDHLDHKKYSLTLGIKAAAHDCILLTDADCRPGSDSWISLMSAPFARKHVRIVLGYSQYGRGPGFMNRFIRFETLLTGIQYLTLAVVRLPYMGVGRNLAYRKSFFLDCKGFNGLLRMTGGDDDLFVNRHASARNTRVCIGPRASTYSVPHHRWSDYFRQKIRHLAVGKEYGAGTLILPGLFTFSFVLTWVLGIVLLFASDNYVPVIYVLGGRSLWVTFTCWIISLKLGDRWWPGFIPVLDFVYVIYYLTIAPVALFTRKARWKD